jgi:hypothetical protein
MPKCRFGLIVLIAGIVLGPFTEPSRAEPPTQVPAKHVEGKFGFVWSGFSGRRLPKCKRIGAKEIRSFAELCEKTPASASQLGNPGYECKARKGKQATLIFESLEICKLEWETMDAQEP